MTPQPVERPISMTDDELVELSDCPFCGCHASLYTVDGEYWVQCDMCSARTASCQFKDNAPLWWNNRFDDDTRLVELLKERDEAATRIEDLRQQVEILRVRECGTWCDPSLNEHTSYCREARAALTEKHNG